MVMKDRLAKTHRKGKRANPKKIAIALVCVLFAGGIVAASTYISKIDNSEKKGIAETNDSQEILNESSDSELDNSELSSYLED